MASTHQWLILIIFTRLRVTLAADPSVVIIPDSILKPVGEGVYLSCKARVDDPDLVTEMFWTAPNGEQVTNVNDDLYTVSTAEDGTKGKLDLIITSLMEQDVGVYTCSAIYAGNHKLEAKVNVESYTEIDFGDTPTHQSLLIGKEGKVRCTPRAKPPPQVDWFKNYEPLLNDNHLIIQQDGILISEVTEADEGTYKCRASVPTLGSVKHLEIQVEAYMPPSITKPPLNTTGKETEEATFECGAIGKPAPQYTWVDNNNSPIENGGDFHMNTDTGILKLMNLKPEQSGEYRCTASNHAGDDFKSAFLQVYSKPKIEEFLNVTTQTGNDLEMKCIVTGDPVPRVVFKKEGPSLNYTQGFIPDPRVRVEQTQDMYGRQVASLHIANASRQDDGLYTCTAVSEGGVAQRWGHITVEFSPTFEEQPDTEFWSWENSPVNLTCLATSIPNATIQWYLHDEEIERHDVNVERLALGPLGVLRVHPVSSRYYGSYTCKASNTLGTASIQVKLKEARLPGYVISSRVEKKTATTITWRLVEPSDTGGLPIQSFLVEYREAEHPWEEAILKSWNKGSTYTIENLRPMLTYVFRFAARSLVGAGPWSAEKSELMPSYAVPEQPLIFDSSNTVSPHANHYELQWKVPLSNGKDIDFFQIIYYQVQNKDGGWEALGKKMKREVKYPGTTSYRIEGLLSDTHYKIELRAHNDIGFSTPAEIIIRTSFGSDPVTEQELKKTHIGIIVGIVLAGIVVIVLLLDMICCCTRKAGLFAKLTGRSRNQKNNDISQQRFDTVNIGEGYPIDDYNGPIKSWTPGDDGDDNDRSGINTTTADWNEPAETTPMMMQRHNNGSSEMMNSSRAEIDRVHIIEPRIVGCRLKTPKDGNKHRLDHTTEHFANDANRNASASSLNQSYSSDNDSIYSKPFENNSNKSRPEVPVPQSTRNDNLAGVTEINNGIYLKEDTRNFSNINNMEEDHFGRSYKRYSLGYPVTISDSRENLDQRPHFELDNLDENGLSRFDAQHSNSNQDDTIFLDPITISERRDDMFQPNENGFIRSEMHHVNSNQDPTAMLANPAGALGSRENLIAALGPSGVQENRFRRSQIGYKELEKDATNVRGNRIRSLDNLLEPSNSKPRTSEPMIIKPLNPLLDKRSRSRDALEDIHTSDPLSNSNLSSSPHLMKNGHSLNDYPASNLINTPPKPPSIASYTTLYQPADTTPQHTGTRIAYMIAPYDEPCIPKNNLSTINRPQGTPNLKSLNYNIKQTHVDDSPITHKPQNPQRKDTPQTNTRQSDRDEKPLNRSTPPWAAKNYDNWRIPPPPLPLHIPKRKDKKSPNHYSLSMDNLDVSLEDNNLPSLQPGSPHNLPVTRSLNNLLDDPSLRSYGKPTLL